jgi:2-hydroxychromene-2-carboxylate isomerase
MHDALYASGGRLHEDEIVATAAALGLDSERLRAELRDGTHAARVARHREAGCAAGSPALPGSSPPAASSTARSTPAP